MELVSVTVRHAVRYEYKCSILDRHESTLLYWPQGSACQVFVSGPTVHNSNTVLYFCTDFVIETSHYFIQSQFVNKNHGIRHSEGACNINHGIASISTLMLAGLHKQSLLLCFK